MNGKVEIKKLEITPVRSLDELGVLMEGDFILFNGTPVIFRNLDDGSLSYVTRGGGNSKTDIYWRSNALGNLSVDGDKGIVTNKFINSGINYDGRYGGGMINLSIISRLNEGDDSEREYDQKLKEVGL